MNKIAVLVVGSGGYGGVVLKEILKDSPSDMEIVAIVDPYAEKSPLFTTITEMNIPIFEDMEGAFSTLRAQGIQVQFTYIATPIQFQMSYMLIVVSANTLYPPRHRHQLLHPVRCLPQHSSGLPYMYRVIQFQRSL